MEGSVSDNSSGDGRQKNLLLSLLLQLRKGKSKKNGKLVSEANARPQAVANGKGQKLSRANMKKHDRQWALLISHNGREADADKQIEQREGRKERTNSSEETSDSLDNQSKSSAAKSRRKKKKKRRVSLPGVSSSLCRSFPLPGPAQIESYLKAYDSVDLNTRSNSPQNSSSADNMSLES